MVTERPTTRVVVMGQMPAANWQWSPYAVPLRAMQSRKSSMLSAAEAGTESAPKASDRDAKNLNGVFMLVAPPGLSSHNIAGCPKASRGQRPDGIEDTVCQPFHGLLPPGDKSRQYG